MIGIVDYGLGNLRSVQGALEYLGAGAIVSRDPALLMSCDKLVLPGVGSFRVAMENIRMKGLYDVLRQFPQVHQRPILGICLGMQLLAERGEEDGPTSGLGLVPGSVSRFAEAIRPLPVPHVGFNTVEFVRRDRWLYGALDARADFYFVHSYRFDVADEGDVAAWCEYGERFVAAIQRGCIYGTQFHPEKSQTNGLRVLENFVQLRV